MTTSVTHMIETVSPSGEVATSRHDFSVYKARSPHWDKYAREVMKPFLVALASQGYKVNMITL